MFMRVRERGDEIQIELTGVAGRHERILRAVFECRQSAGRPLHAAGEICLPDVSVRARSNAMRISVRPRDGLHLEAASIYQSLRRALFSGDPAVAL